MTIMHLIRVNSHVRALGFKAGEATVRFHSGLVRNYPMDILKFQEWMTAPFKGLFFREHVQFNPATKTTRRSRKNGIASGEVFEGATPEAMRGQNC